MSHSLQSQTDTNPQQPTERRFFSFRPEDRRVGEPELSLLPGCKETWVLKVSTWGTDTTCEEERRSLPLHGFGSHLYHEYYELAHAKALAYVQRNGLVLSDDRSTVAGIDMVVFRRKDGVEARTSKTSLLSF